MASWHPDHNNQHRLKDHHGDCCLVEPGVRIRPVTFAELEGYLERLADPVERTPAPTPRVVGITYGQQAGFLDQYGRPGRSAMAEYRRRRTDDWQAWSHTLALRVSAILATGVGVGLLTAAVAGSGVARLTGLAAAALGWWLRFRPSADTLAWRHGIQGERRTADLLAPLGRQGYQVFHDLAIPGSAANVDHLVVGPTGVFVIDSKRYRGHVHYSAGRLWHGRRPLDRTLETLWWEATQVAETLGFGPDLHVYPVLCIHVAQLPWLDELIVDGIPILDAAALRPALQVTRQALSPGQVDLIGSQVRVGFQQAT